jgi:hypothetical protein
MNKQSEPVAVVIEESTFDGYLRKGIAWNFRLDSFDIGTKFYTTPQPKQEQGEPAFYGFMDKNDCCVHICYTPWAAGGPNNELPTAYYTTPQQRTLPQAERAAWVGLTDEEVVQIRDDMTLDIRSHVDFYRHCEAKLKEKNT